MDRVQTQFLICRKSGCSLAPLASFLPMLCASGMLGQSWDHVGLMLGYLRGILWFVLAFVGQALGPYWAYLGKFWAMLGHFGPRWHHIGLMLSHFNPFWWISFICVGLCLGLGHFSVVEFSSMQGVCKRHRK